MEIDYLTFAPYIKSLLIISAVTDVKISTFHEKKILALESVNVHTLKVSTAVKSTPNSRHGDN